VLPQRSVVISGAPGTGKSTIANALASGLGLPLLSLDMIKETLADVLGTGDEAWSDQLGDSAAEVIFRLRATMPASIVEGWWRGPRRERALGEFVGCVEVFCRCDPDVAEIRMRERAGARHPIHRDVINPQLLERVADAVRTARPLGVGVALVEVDTTHAVDMDDVLARVKALLSHH
jgi:glucokinase